MLNRLLPVSSEPLTLGQLGERLAQIEYRNRGCKIVAANFFNDKGKRAGEIDLVVADKHNIIFVEVKTRTEEKGRHGTPAEAVNRFKQVKLLKAVKIFLLTHPKYREFRPQIDVCSIIIEDFTRLRQVEAGPAKYLPDCALDKISRNVKIIPNAVEDWN